MWHVDMKHGIQSRQEEALEIPQATRRIPNIHQ